MTTGLTATDTPIGSAPIGPDDPRYRAVVDKRFNKRFRVSPDYVRLARTTEEVVAAVQDAVREGRRLVVTSGGHCLEGFVSDPDVRVILDVSPMKRIELDAAMGAIVVEAGATVGETLGAMAEGWNVALPFGQHPAVGMGGHVAGGGFGFLHRQLGLVVDYLHAVEVVTVDAEGRATAVIATREPSDPNHDLWWGHTGGGAGNFGVATRFWFRSREASGASPALPTAPESISTFEATWSWSDIDRASFITLVQNHGRWCERHADAGSPYASLFTGLELHRKQFGTIVVRGVSSAGDSAVAQWAEHLAALSEGIVAPTGPAPVRLPWIEFACNPLPDFFTFPPDGVSIKMADALLRQRLTDQQIEAAYGQLVSTGHDVMGGVIGMATYGGRINTVARDATAASQRGSIIDLACNVGWMDPRDEAKSVAWVRECYRALFADTGGVPVPGDKYEGALINHPDVDLANPEWNRSGVPWHTFYFNENYPRLQRIKARWDPSNVFRHALSIRAD